MYIDMHRYALGVCVTYGAWFEWVVCFTYVYLLGMVLMFGVASVDAVG